MADSVQPLPKTPSNTESDGDPDVSVYLTPKEKREVEKKEKERFWGWIPKPRGQTKVEIWRGNPTQSAS